MTNSLLPVSMIVQGSSASALFTDVVSGPIWIRAVGRGADGMKHHTEWLSFTVE